MSDSHSQPSEGDREDNVASNKAAPKKWIVFASLLTVVILGAVWALVALPSSDSSIDASHKFVRPETTESPTLAGNGLAGETETIGYDATAKRVNAPPHDGVGVKVFGNLVLDPRGHLEICPVSLPNDEPCAGLPIIGASDEVRLEELNRERSATGGALDMLYIDGLLNTDGVWITTILEDEVGEFTGRQPSDQQTVRSKGPGFIELDENSSFSDRQYMSEQMAYEVLTHVNEHITRTSRSNVIDTFFQSVEDPPHGWHAVILTSTADAELRNELEAIAQQASTKVSTITIEVQPWIEVVDTSITELPHFYESPSPLITHAGPVIPIPLPTEVGSVAFDEHTRCPNVVTGGESHVTMWPFGFTASVEQGAITDFDGNVIARDGDNIQLSGLYSRELTDNDQDCGRGDEVFVVSHLVE